MSPATPAVLNTVTPTADPDTTQSHDEAARGRLVRRIVLGCFTVFVALGLMGVFGYRQGTTTSEAHGLRVEVEHSTGTEIRQAETLVRREPGGAQVAYGGLPERKPCRRSAHWGSAE